MSKLKRFAKTQTLRLRCVLGGQIIARVAPIAEKVNSGDNLRVLHLEVRLNRWLVQCR